MILVERFGIGLLVVSVASVVLSGQIIDRKASDKIPGFEAYAGDDIGLPCGGNDSWNFFDVTTWMKQKDNETIALARKEYGKVIDVGQRSYRFIGQTDLFIPKLTDNDAGLYACQLEKNTGEVLSTTYVTLEVKVLCRVPILSPHLKSVNCQSLDTVSKNHICTFRCGPGYTLIGSHEVVCLSNGLFSRPMPGCYVIPKFQAYAGDDAFLACTNLTDLKEDDTLYWKRYKATTYTTLLKKTNGETITWGERGISVVNKTVLLIPTVTKEDNALYQCKIVKTSMVKVYLRNVTLEVKETCSWPKLSPELQLHPRSCDRDFIIEGEKCSFQCKKGYRITQNTTVSCLPDGRFSALIPSCRVVNCTIAKFGSHLRLEMGQCQENGSVPYGTTCFFSCGLNHQLKNGDANRTCQDNSTLSGMPGVCKETDTQSTSFIILMVVVSLILLTLITIYIVHQRSQQPQTYNRTPDIRRISTEE